MVYWVQPFERIALAMARKGWKGTRLARELGISQPSLHPVLKGDQPGDKHMPRIAELLEVPHEWLTVGDNPPVWAASPLPVKSGESRGLPVVGSVSAGDGNVPADWDGSPQREIHWPDTWVAVKIDGLSAYPVAFPGQLAVIDQARVLVPAAATIEEMQDLHDNLVLIHTREGGKPRAYLKRFCVDERAPDKFVLASINAGRSSPYLPASIIDDITPVVAFILEDPRLPRKKGRNKAVITL